MKLLVFIILFVAVGAQAAEDDKLGFHHESEVGYIVVGGNAKSESFSGKQSSMYQWDKDNAKLSASYLNAKARDNETQVTSRTAENWEATLRWEHIVIEKKFDTYAQAGLMKDHFRGIDLGTSYGLGGKYHWINAETLKLFSELGYTYLNEELDGNAGPPIVLPSTLESHFVRLFSQIDYEHTKSMKVGLKVEYLQLYVY